MKKSYVFSTFPFEDSKIFRKQQNQGHFNLEYPYVNSLFLVCFLYKKKIDKITKCSPYSQQPTPFNHISKIRHSHSCIACEQNTKYLPHPQPPTPPHANTKLDLRYARLATVKKFRILRETDPLPFLFFDISFLNQRLISSPTIYLHLFYTQIPVPFLSQSFLCFTKIYRPCSSTLAALHIEKLS